MKPFDLVRAVVGDPFVLVLSSECDTIPVRFIGELTDHRIVVERRAESGVYYVEVCPDARLRMAPKKRTVYLNIMEGGPAAWFVSAYAAETAVHMRPVIAWAVPVEISE